MTAVATRPAGPLRRFTQADTLDLVLQLSAVAVVIASHYDVPLMVVTAAVAVAVLARADLRHHWLTWVLGAVALAAYQLPQWYEYDNHVWLTTYWVLAVGLSLRSRDPMGALAFQGRLFVGIIFAVAAIWKVATPDFRENEFFQYELLRDERFATWADLAGGIDAETWDANDAAARALTAQPPDTVAALESSDRVPLLSFVFTWWGILIESVIGLVWLLPLARRWRWMRHGSLLLFAGTTYLLVPVGGFGCLLMVLGLTQTHDEPRWRTPYLVGFVALLLYGPIWLALFGP